MIHMAIYLLFLAFTLVVPDFQKQQLVSDRLPSSPLVEEDVFFPIALKYRQELLQIIETNLCNTFTLPSNSSEVNRSSLLFEVTGQTFAISDPCYTFMSMQL